MAGDTADFLPDGNMLSPAYLEMTLQLDANDSASTLLLEVLPEALQGVALATTYLLPSNASPAIIFTAHFEAHADRGEINARLALVEAAHGVKLQPSFTLLPPTNWLEVAYQAHPPLKLGRFVVYGSHDRPVLSADLIGLEIEAATAFGTGQHGTTAGCLLVLDQLMRSASPPQSVADIGTGSGILALAAYKLWHCPVTATDIDPECIRVTRTHLRANNVPEGRDGVTLCVADGTQDRTIVDNGPYDLVIANILAGPLKDMAGDLVSLCSTAGGRILLSGLLTSQFDEVVAAYQDLGCRLETHTTRDEWSIVLLSR